MSLSKISDHELVANFRDLVIEERERLALSLEYLAELDRRKLFYHHSSLRSFLVEEYGMEEWCAERRIRAARMLKRFPKIKEMLESGKLNLTLLELAQGCAHRENMSDPELGEILRSISGMSSRAAMKELASRFPETFVIPKDRIRPITAELSEVKFIASDELLEKLDEIRGLLAHSHPGGLTMTELIDVLATEYRERHHPEEKARRAREREVKKQDRAQPETQTEKVESPTAPWARTQSDQPQDTHLVEKEAPLFDHQRIATPSMVHALAIRDGYRCSYTDDVTGKHCLSTHALEIDHVQTWASGGKTEIQNLRFLCIQHHRRVSFLQFGESSKYSGFKRE